MRYDPRTRAGTPCSVWANGAGKVAGRLWELDATDNKGIVWALGTGNDSVPSFVNPATSGRLTLTQSSTIYTVNNLTDRDTILQSGHTNNGGTQWFKFDFGTGLKVDPTHLRIRQRRDDTANLHGNLNIEGSNDNTAWTMLGTLTSPTQTSGTWNQATLTPGASWRYVRLSQIGNNSSGQTYFAAAEAELFGWLFSA